MSALDPFDTIRRFRLAAREIVRDESLAGRRSVALAALVEQAVTELGDDPWLLRAVRDVLWAESREFLEHGKTPTAPTVSWTADPVLTACRMLRARGLNRCRECRRALPTLDELARWEDRNRAGWLEAIRREEAPEREAAAAGSLLA